MHLSQLIGGGVICRKGDDARLLPGAPSILHLAQAGAVEDQRSKAITGAVEHRHAGDVLRLATMSSIMAKASIKPAG